VLKRIFDFSVSFKALIFLLLPMGMITIVLLFFTKGVRAIRNQPRTAKNAKLFQKIKFKTMTDERYVDGKLLPDEVQMAPIGGFLCSNSLDELPLLINVLKGDMSVVWPRPLLEKYIRLYSPAQFRRHEVRPGITGWAQIDGRNNISSAKKFELDVCYLDNQIILLEIKILWLIILNVIKRKDITTEDTNAFQPVNGTN
jgi:undecaprenyl phosphate N,N'-diacetylbacillosamine 1-phosphate transferase